MASLGAAFACPSLSPAIAAQIQGDQPKPPANRILPIEGGWGPFTPSSAVGRYLQLVYPSSTTKGELQIGVMYTLWIPDDIKTVKAVIVHQHGASIPAAQAGATSAYDLHWQALAKKWDGVLLGPSYHVLNDAIDLTPGGAELWFDPRLGSDRVFLRALDEFAAKSGHAEIATAPWCLWGHSGGGIWANVMSILHPDRVLAAFLRSGTAAMFRPKHEFIQPEVPPAAYEIPTMVNFGVGERGNFLSAKLPCIRRAQANLQIYRNRRAANPHRHCRPWTAGCWQGNSVRDVGWSFEGSPYLDRQPPEIVWASRKRSGIALERQDGLGKPGSGFFSTWRARCPNK
jgi:hypothetical protein